MFTHGQDVVFDFRRGEGDRIMLDDAALPMLRGLRMDQIVNRYADDTGPDVVLDFGNGNRLLLENVASTYGLHLALDVI